MLRVMTLAGGPSAATALMMVMCVLLAGCGDVELPDIDVSLPGTESSEPVASESEVADEPAAQNAAVAQAPVVMSPEQVVAAFAAKPAHSLTDADIAELAGLKSGLDAVTELDLTSPSITGQSIELLSAFPLLKKINLQASRVTGPELAPLSGLTQLEWLNLGRTGLDDDSLKCVEGLSSLRHLDISDTRVTDNGFVHLTGLSSLEELNVSRLRITGAGMEALGNKGARAPLRSIVAVRTEFGRLGFVFLKEFDQLEVLEVQSGMVTDSSLDGLRGCDQIRSLTLSENMLTDVGVATLSKLKNLEVLRLKGMRPVSDASVERLRTLKNLTEIDLNGTSCSGASVQVLKKASPECRVLLNEQQF
jgi:hypothetical protein